MRFFKPLPNFIPWLKAEVEKKHKFVIEAGCGEGHVIRAMRSAKIKCFGCDPRYMLFDEPVPDDLVSCLMPLKAQACETLKVDPTCIVLVCRPCHNGFPMELNELRHPRSRMLYVGHPHNIETDLGNYRVERAFDEVVGEDGEQVYEVFRDRGSAEPRDLQASVFADR